MTGTWIEPLARRLRRTLLRLPREHRVPPANPSYIYLDDDAPRTVMVTMLGVSSELIGEIVDRTTEQFGPAFRLVYLTDAEDLSEFLARDAFFEYVPNAMRRQLHADKLNWQPYLAERWTLLQAKWNPVRILTYGEPLDATAEAGRSAAR